MEFAVSRAGTTLVTLHEGTDTTACAEARTAFETTLETLAADGTITTWEITQTAVYEPPTAPFDPYTIAVEFTITVPVDAADAEAARERGATAIDAALETAEAESVTYTSSPTASAA